MVNVLKIIFSKKKPRIFLYFSLDCVRLWEATMIFGLNLIASGDNPFPDLGKKLKKPCNFRKKKSMASITTTGWIRAGCRTLQKE